MVTPAVKAEVLVLADVRPHVGSNAATRANMKQDMTFNRGEGDETSL